MTQTERIIVVKQQTATELRPTKILITNRKSNELPNEQSAKINADSKNTQDTELPAVHR
jgi:hypothetical protein